LSFGPNMLIRDGAPLIRGVDDVLEHLGLLATKGCQAPSVPKDPVLSRLEKDGIRSIDQLVADTGLDTSMLMVRLSELELEGRVERLPGTLFRSATPA
jgi:DNA processing protein